MNPARSTSAMMMPTMSTRCWCCRGTANFDMMMTKTNRLSMLSEYSVSHPAKNSPAGVTPPTPSTIRPNTIARPT